MDQQRHCTNNLLVVPVLKIHVAQKIHQFLWIKIFLDCDIISHISTETNRYAHQHFNTHELAPHSQNTIKSCDTREMRLYLGTVFMTGIDKRPEIKGYWSIRPLFHTPLYGQKMSLRGFQHITKCLHFTDKDARPADCANRLYKVRPIIDSLMGKLETHISLRRKLQYMRE
jgi:hypothetical protein